MEELIRVARPEDAAAIAAVHTSSTDDSYAPLAAEWQPGQVAERTALWAKAFEPVGPEERAVLLVTERRSDGEIIAFAAAGRARRDGLGVGLEVHVIHVAPPFRGQGVGDRLWRATCEALRGPDDEAFYVDTLEDLRCRSFYERHGGVLVDRAPMPFCGTTRMRVTYLWPQGASVT